MIIKNIENQIFENVFIKYSIENIILSSVEKEIDENIENKIRKLGKNLMRLSYQTPLPIQNKYWGLGYFSERTKHVTLIKKRGKWIVRSIHIM